MSSAARIAATAGSPTTPAAIAIAPSARARRRKTGSQRARPISCRSSYFHLVFTLPAEIAGLAYQNKAVVYDLLFRTAAETLLTIAADPKHLGARIGATTVLHSWGPAMTTPSARPLHCTGRRISLDRNTGCTAAPASSYPCGCSPACSDGCSWPSLAEAHAAGRLPSLANSKASDAGRPLPRNLAPARQEELVRLRQAALRRARDGTRLSRPLHPPRGHLERPPPRPRPRRARRELPLQGLPPQRPGAVYPAPRRSPKPGSGPRCHDADHRLIAPLACRGTLLPPLHRCRPAASEGKVLHPRSGQSRPSTAAAAPNSPPRSSIRCQRCRPTHPLRNHRPPRVPSWEAFGRRPSARADRSRRAGIRNPSPKQSFSSPLAVL